MGIITLYLLTTKQDKSDPVKETTKAEQSESPDRNVDLAPPPADPVVVDESVPEVQRFDQFNQLPAKGKNAGERAVVFFNNVEFVFRWCPAGTFTMGSPETEEGRDTGETQHQVTLTKGFWMLETEVTQKQWETVMGDNPSEFKGDDLPVENVSWDDCQEFCKKTGFLLPTAAQWEYACRAGTTGAYAGNLEEMAWNVSNFSGMTTHPVGIKKPNAWGLYDMHGNVWEWCQDRYGDYPLGSVTDPTGPSNGSDRVLRGGCFINSAQDCRSANYSSLGPDIPSPSVGFRIIRGQ